MTTLPPITAAPAKRARSRGFSLVEVIVATTLSGLVLSGVMTSFLHLGRSGANLASYAAMEAEARRSLELFARDVRQASAITWNSTQNITLNVQGTDVTYALVSAGTDLQFQRDGAPIVTGVVPDSFALIGYTIQGIEIDPNDFDLTALGQMTKQLQLSLRAARSNVTTARATNTVLSARFILRNKKVT